MKRFFLEMRVLLPSWRNSTFLDTSINVWPKNLPEELQTTTYCKELNVFIAAPLALCAASKHTLVRLAVRIHGGGAVSAGAVEPPSLG
jgi:hypothetical protein